jgi:DNA polymerase-4
MDAFYASVEQLDNPEFKGRPVIVGANPKEGRGRGVVAACSYEARKFGVRSALPISQAWKLCPDGVYVRPRMERYAEVSSQVMEVLRGFTDLVEPMSIDEAFLDVTGSHALFGPVEQIARDIKLSLREATGLTASVGAAPNKFIAKIASDLRKPDGLVIVREGETANFLHDLPISRVWGVGPKTEERLQRMGFRTIGQLSEASRESLLQKLGPLGEHLHQLSHGNDERPVITNWEAKSIGAETTFDEDTADRQTLRRTIQELSDRVGRRLRRSGFRAGRITVKLRYEDFETHTKQTSVDRPVQSDAEIVHLATSLLEQFPLSRKIRLIGVSAGDFQSADDPGAQMNLFASPVTTSVKADTLDRTVDRLREKFGDDALKRGSHLSDR